MDDVVAISLFRHGLTEANKRHAYLGWSDSPLCQKAGRVERQYDFLFSSDLGRCLETAKMLFPDNQPHPHSEFREMNFGAWEGKTYEDLKLDPEYQTWLADPFSTKPPDGESFKEFSERVDSGWKMVTDAILSASLKKVAIVTHGGVIRTFLSKWAPEEMDFWDWQAHHGKGYELIWTQDGLRRGERCTSLREVPLTANQTG
ncbi:hypothetical protein F7731_25105 [Cytobacillus depressus]|uniref:Histidine phosphatase family protein n=1 Tax=Cytobacillus depressus TaxID=1602942 RepID=A0A6L3UXD1_9BACI|nr:histidine phosphatase family protein [Cytobacillus depressus]KAB2328599.1 hypothetical protein F7731_25105 [Cytobacillus depressus]